MFKNATVISITLVTTTRTGVWTLVALALTVTGLVIMTLDINSPMLKNSYMVNYLEYQAPPSCPTPFLDRPKICSRLAAV